MRQPPPRSLKQAYLDWVEAQVEDYKESVPRSELLRIADEAVEELRVNQRGQYQLTELLLLEAVDRKIIRALRLPGFRAWAASRPEPPPAADPLAEPGDASN